MSGFQVSPGVQVKEIDLTNVVPAVSTSVGGYAGDFTWGPVDEVTLVVSEKDLVAKFGKPSISKVSDFMSATFFLNYSNALRVVRAIDTTASNATTDDVTTNVVIKNLDHYETQDGSFGGPLTVSIALDITAGATEVTVVDAAGLTVGDVIVGAEFAVGTTITAIAGNVLTLSEVTAANIEGLTTPVDYVVNVNKGTFAAKYPGVLGNSLSVEICS